MSQREQLLVLAHAQICTSCRDRLLHDPASVLVGRALSAQEKEALARLQPEDFLSPAALARAVGSTPGDLYTYSDHPIARLRHF